MHAQNKYNATLMGHRGQANVDLAVFTDQLLSHGAWRFRDATVAVSRDRTFGLYQQASGIPISLPALEDEFFVPIPASGFSAPADALPADCRDAPLQPAIFVMTQRLESFQIFDVLRHGIGTFEHFQRAFGNEASSAGIPIFMLDTSSSRAIQRGRLQALRAKQIIGSTILTFLAMGFNRSDSARALTHSLAVQHLNWTCVRAQEVWGGHEAWQVWKGSGAAKATALRLAVFRRAIARTLRFDYPPLDRLRPPLALFVLRRSAPRRILNDGELLADTRLGEQVQQATGLQLRFIRFEELPLEEQLRAVVSARLLVGNHGTGLTWSALLPSDISSGNTAVIELFANASSERLPRDVRMLASANAVRHVAVPQPTGERCCGRPMLACGDIFVDKAALLHQLQALGSMWQRDHA